MLRIALAPLAALLFVTATPLNPVLAQGFPNKAIRLIVAVGAGGGMDITARIIAQKLAEQLGQGVAVENRTGAGTVVGTDYVAKAPPDGYTILFGGISNISINPGLYANLPYHPLKDFTPIAMLVDNPFILVAHNGLAASSVRELIALAKAKPGSLNYASAGTGTLQHLAGEMFKMMAAIEIVHVPFRGAGAAYPEVQSGQVHFFIDNITPAQPHIKAGRVKAIAVTTKARSAAFPDLPTMAEAGLADYELGSWFGLFAPVATPKDVVAKLRAETKKALAAPDVRERFESQSGIILDMTPEQEVAFLASELERWTRIVKASGAKAE